MREKTGRLTQEQTRRVGVAGLRRVCAASRDVCTVSRSDGRARKKSTADALAPCPAAQLRTVMERGVRDGLGHRFAAAWVRVRAAFGDG